MSRLKKRRLLGCVETPRWVRGGFRRGTYNQYFITPRGRERAEWWRDQNSLVGFTYLGRGVGDPREAGMLFASALIDNIATDDPRLFRVNSSKHAFSELMTYRNPIDLLPYSILDGRWRLLFSIQRLQQEGLVPTEIVRDLAWFHSIAKGLGCEDQQIAVALLKRSAVYWKNKSEYLELQNTFLKLELDIQGLVDRLIAQRQTEPLKQENLTLKIQNAFLNFRNSALNRELTFRESELNREVTKLRWHLQLTNTEMQNVCSTLTHVGDHSPTAKFTTEILTHLQIMNLGV
jgi:hypothetical protein